MERTAGSTSSTSKPPKASEDHKVESAPRSTLGRVIGAHGLRGELRVRLLDETDNNLRAAASVWLAREEGDPKAVEARVRAVGSGRRGEAIWETGAPAVLVVVDEARREHLIPAASEIVREVDVVARRIVIEAPPGLLE
jgi:ribosomal 30S subunit maturation factor RimM